jgi:hypothetical protein
MNAYARRALNQLWKPALLQAAGTKGERRVLAQGARSKVGGDGFSMLAATSKRKLSGGLVPSEQWHGFEFGAVPKQVSVWREPGINSPGVGRRTDVTTGKQFKARRKNGYVVFPTVRKVMPRIAAEYVQAIVASLKHRIEGSS